MFIKLTTVDDDVVSINVSNITYYKEIKQNETIIRLVDGNCIYVKYNVEEISNVLSEYTKIIGFTKGDNNG